MDEMAILKFVRKVLKKDEIGLSSISKPVKQSYSILKFESIEASLQF